MIELDPEQLEDEAGILEVYQYEGAVVITLTGNGQEIGTVLDKAEALELADALARAALTEFTEESYRATVH